ncbi:MAG: hypothetical protein PHC88_04695 [Terrimicrobiaceae bacterium]|nr:hypothetical protein [Terrimicrobiaceae bacterium]
MPGFTGNFHNLMSPYLGGQGVLSWNAGGGQDAEMGMYQDSIRRFSADSNVVSYMEPHAEMKHGEQDTFLEYGPEADANFRRLLKSKYGTPGGALGRKREDVERCPRAGTGVLCRLGAADAGRRPGTWGMASRLRDPRRCRPGATACATIPPRPPA